MHGIYCFTCAGEARVIQHRGGPRCRGCFGDKLFSGRREQFLLEHALRPAAEVPGQPRLAEVERRRGLSGCNPGRRARVT